MRSQKGFVIIIVLALIAVIVIIATVIIGLGCGEIIQTKMSNDTVSARYVAISGAEMLYAKLKAQEGGVVVWPQTIPPGANTVRTIPAGGGVEIGTFTATANTAGIREFGIVSQGTVNGRTARMTVKYGFDSPFTNGYPIGCLGSMQLSGHKLILGIRSWVRAEGPISSGSTITTNNYVQVSGDILQNQTLQKPSFWLKYDASTSTWTQKTIYDTNGDGERITDIDGDTLVTAADAQGDAVKLAIFNADDTYNDGVINDKDAFYTYYTVELNTAENLNIGPGQANYYTGEQNFDPDSVAVGTRMIFVNGDVNIAFNDTAWWGADVNHTIASMGNIAIVQPTNGSGDTLTLLAWGNVDTGGIRAFGGIRGNLVIYANADFNAYYGGRTNGTIFAGGDVNIDTVWPIPGLLNRDLNRSKDDWADPASWPLGLPPNFNMLSLSFRILNENSVYKPRWQNE